MGLSGRVALGAVLGRLLGPSEDERHVYIGRYRLGRRLGQGAYGAVYRAYDPEVDRHVALKIIRPSGRRELRRLRARIDREAHALARLRHPNVVGVFDTGQACVDAEGNEGVYLAMELVQGQTLLEWSRRTSPPWRALVSTYLVAGRALVAAHAVGIIHRDFKPTNVMVADDGTVKVLDFGMARSSGGTDTDTYSAGWSENAVTAVSPVVTAADMTAADMSGGPLDLLDDALTLSDELMGTPRYMAPEQHDGSSATHAADQ
jgi:serine/threonine protein kinase